MLLGIISVKSNLVNSHYYEEVGHTSQGICDCHIVSDPVGTGAEFTITNE